MSIGNFSSSAILINGASATGNAITGNHLGVDLPGTSATGNNNGVAITGGATGNTIGGDTANERNIISGNGNGGVDIFGVGVSGNSVQGNYIGTDVTGTLAIPNSEGIDLRTNASNNLIGGTAAGTGNLISGNTTAAIDIQTSDSNSVAGNLIGTTVTGLASLENREGIFLSGGASHNIIGGTTAAARNIISGNNGEGIHIQTAGSDSNVVQGNYIGLGSNGSTPVGNGGNGIEILLAASDNFIGGTAAGAGNVISDNTQFGVSIQNTGTTGNRVEGNFIGTDAAGTVPLGNSLGISIASGATDNIVGGSAAGAGNLISGHTQSGIQIVSAGTSRNVVQGNLIGTDVTGTLALGNSIGVNFQQSPDSNLVGGISAGQGNIIAFNVNDGVVMQADAGNNNAVLGNSIFENGGLGIDLSDDGMSVNDGGDPDGGPNQTQNSPVIAPNAVYNDGTNEMSLSYLVSSDPSNAAYPIRVEFFLADSDDQEGQTFIGFDEYTSTDFAGGNKAIVFNPVATVPVGSDVIATATDSTGNTSEFSAVESLLPVELASFQVRLDDGRAILTWKTVSETNNAGFEIESLRPDGGSTGDWQVLGFVEGAGTTLDPHSYSFVSDQLAPGTIAFRLKQLDYDGGFSYSPVVEVTLDVPRELTLYPNYPNPFNPATTISFVVPVDGRAVLSVYNVLGRRVATLFDGIAEPGRIYRASLDAGGLASGQYIGILEFNGRREQIRMLALK